MIKLVPSWVYWLVIAVLVTTLGAQHLLHRAAVADMRAQHAQTLKSISDLAASAAQKALAVVQSWNATVAAVDTKHSKEKDDEIRDNETRRAAVVRGDQRLRIAASCPARSGDVSQATAAPSLDAQTTVELSPATGQAVFDLRAALIEDRAKLAGLQQYVAQVCQVVP